LTPEAAAALSNAVAQLSSPSRAARPLRAPRVLRELPPLWIAGERHPKRSSRTRRANGSRGRDLKRLATLVRRQAVQRELADALRGREEEIDLFHAALLVSKYDNADLDIEAYRRQLEQMAGELRQKIKAGARDRARLDA